MGDLLTVTQYDLPIKIVVFDNSALGMVKLKMEVAGFPDYETDLRNPNFANLAQAIGVMEDVSKIHPTSQRDSKRAFTRSGPALIGVVTDPNAVNCHQLMGFGITIGKLVLSGHIDEVADTINANLRTL